MMHPMTSFNFENGTAAPPGTFNNAFGCTTLSSSGTCTNPIQQSIQLVVPTGDPLDQAILNTIAGTVNNVSSTYNMGLTVTVEPLPSGTVDVYAYSGEAYIAGGGGWFDDYPWAIDFLGPLYAGSISTAEGWNSLAMNQLYQDAVNASARGDLARIVQDTDAMNTIANQAVIYLWTFYPEYFYAYTSNVQGFYWNPTTILDGPYFAAYSPSSVTTTATSASAAPSSSPIMAAAAVVIIIIVAGAAVVLRNRGKKPKS
jgi:hypothetical protein